jgi:MarR family transcriptional regulator, organic hydroperoxide resistance regulator
MEQARSSEVPKRRKTDPLDHVIWHIGRTYYAYIGLLERVLATTGLDKHLRPGMGPILFALFEKDGRSIKQIAERVKLAAPTLTGLLDRMEQAGLLERSRDSADGRVVRVHLTALGRSLEPRCRSAVQQIGAVLDNGMGARDVARARRLLARMTEAMNQAANPSAGGNSERRLP